MKKLIPLLISAGLFLCGFKSPDIYSKTAIVTNVEDDLVTCADSTGNLWEFYSDEEWFKGAICSLLMQDNTIIDAHYDGVTELFDMQVGWEKVHIICDVAECIYIDGNLELYVEMPDGEIEMFYAPPDAPDIVSTVCFETYNQDDLSFYEIVALK